MAGAQPHPRGERRSALDDLGDGGLLPAELRPRQSGAEVERQRLMSDIGEDLRAPGHLAGERGFRGGGELPVLGAHGPDVGTEGEALDVPDGMPFDDDFVAFLDAHRQIAFLPQFAQQQRGPAVDKTLRQPFVQRIRQPVLDIPRHRRPMRRILEPVAPVGDIGPDADTGDARRQAIDIALDIVKPADLAGQPVGLDHTAGRHQLAIDALEERDVIAIVELAEIGDLAHFPQPAHRRGGRRQTADERVFGQRLESEKIARRAHAHELGTRRGGFERRDEARERAEIERRIAPADRLEPGKAVLLHIGDGAGVERHAFGAGDGGEGAVVHMPAGAPGDLCHLRGLEAAHRPAVELGEGGEGDMVDVHIEAHADGVGGDDIVHLAALIERDLRIARARAERPHDDGGAAAMAAHELGERVDRLGGIGDDRRTRRQAAELSRLDIPELGQARPARDRGLRQKAGDQRPDGPGAEKDGLLAAAGTEQAVGEDMSALPVGGELDLVDGDEVDGLAERHRFDGADVIGRIRRENLLLAGEQGDPRRSLDRDHAVVDLARQKTQRKAHHARGMTEHALDRIMGLAGIGRAEHGDDTAMPAAARTTHRSHSLWQP